MADLMGFEPKPKKIKSKFQSRFKSYSMINDHNIEAGKLSKVQPSVKDIEKSFESLTAGSSQDVSCDAREEDTASSQTA